jgi:acyl dehydratase
MREPPAAAKGQGVHDIVSGESRADKLHHEDIEIGRPITFGRKTVTKEGIIGFGRAFDPQPMHTDEEAAKATPVGGLCASGWHTCAMMMRMICDGPLRHTASLGSPGVDEVRWVKPVRPGDVLSCRHVYTEKRLLASRPDVGIAKITIEALNEAGEIVCWWHTNQLTRVRCPAPAPASSAPKPPRAPAPSLWDAPATPRSADRNGFFEDRVVGETSNFGRHTFARDEIVAFAREFDPQPFHLDEAAAKDSLFGGLCASGWHTGAVMMREIVLHRMKSASPLRGAGERRAVYGPSPGFRKLAWPKPVYVGDTIEFRARLAEKIDLRSRPGRGILVSEVQGRNQRGEIVLSVLTQILADRREPYRPD